MQAPKNKQQAMDDLMALEADIQHLAQEKSLATLEHKLSLRQQALEYLFAHFMTDITQADLTLLKEIQLKSQTMLQAMQDTKQEKSEEIIKYKNTGKRIRLYSDIAQQK
jgi:hypothetical protein